MILKTYLGNAMFDYFEGKILTKKQMDLIAMSSPKEQLEAMKFVVVNRLENSNFPEIKCSNFYKNKHTINNIRKIKR